MAKIKLEIETDDESLRGAIEDLASCFLGDLSRQIDNLGTQLNRKLNVIIKKEIDMAASIDQVVQDVNDETTLIASVTTMIKGLREQLLAQGLDAAKVDAAFSGLEANKQALADALVANTAAA